MLDESSSITDSVDFCAPGANCAAAMSAYRSTALRRLSSRDVRDVSILLQKSVAEIVNR
jgi:hypothetical protein